MVLTFDEIKNILVKAVPSLTETQANTAAQALIDATGKWKEVNTKEVLGAGLSVQCRDICALGEAYQKGMHIRAFIAP